MEEEEQGIYHHCVYEKSDIKRWTEWYDQKNFCLDIIVWKGDAWALLATS